MIARSALARNAKLLAQDIAIGDVGASGLGTAYMMAGSPQSILDLVDLVRSEAGKKRSDDDLVAAYCLMCEQALEALRFADERGDPAANVVLGAVRAKLLALAGSGKLDQAPLLLFAQQFAVAKVDLGDDLRSLMGAMLEARSEAMRATGEAGSREGHLSELACDLDGDVFAIYDELSQMASAFPDTHRIAMASSILGAGDEPVRAAASGWLLDPSAAVRAEVAAMHGRVAGDDPAGGTLLRRMIAMRNWLPEAERPALDAAVKSCRQKGIEPAPLALATVLGVLVSGFDGDGAQSVFVAVKKGRKHAVASVLLKQGIGVRDAWVRRDLAKAELDAFLASIAVVVDTYESSMDYLRAALPHFLAANHSSGILPPFGLLDVVETIGVDPLNPNRLGAAEVAARLLDEVRSEGIEPSVEEALEASEEWPDVYPFVDSWFEDGAKLDELFRARRLSAAKQARLVLEHLLPPRRQRWAEKLAWTAFALRNGGSHGDWIDMALVSQELLGDRPLPEFPLMEFLAHASVDVWRAERGD